MNREFRHEMDALLALETPCLLVDEERLLANIKDMTSRLERHAVRFRPHVKTHKCVAIAERMKCRIFQGITVSTLREAEYFAAAGYNDILYGVASSPAKILGAADLLRLGGDLSLVLDHPQNCTALIAHLERENLRAAVMLEVDVDGHRAGMIPEDSRLIDMARDLHQSLATDFAGVMTHAGESYHCQGEQAIAEHAELERSGIVAAARRIEDSGVPCRVISVGSTPTARYGRHFAGVTEIRPGVFSFYDLVMAGIGACSGDEIALSVLTTVISHKRDKRRLIIDAGALALSKDQGTADQSEDCRFGLVADAGDCRIIPGIRVDFVYQEHGVIELPPERRFAWYQWQSASRCSSAPIMPTASQISATRLPIQNAPRRSISGR